MCCAPDKSLNTCVVCLFQPLLVWAFLCLVTENIHVNSKNGHFKITIFNASLKPFQKWASLWKASIQLTFWFQDCWFFFSSHENFHDKMNHMESQGIKSQKKVLEAFFFFFNMLLLNSFLLLLPPPCLVCYCCPSLLSVSVPFFTVVLGSARNKWYPQI